MMKKQTIISLILGGFSLLTCWIVYLTPFSLTAAIVGFVISIKARKTIKLSGLNTMPINIAVALNAIGGVVSGIIFIEFIIYQLLKLFVSSIG